MASPHDIATKDPEAVRRYAQSVFTLLGWPHSQPLLDRAFADVTALFSGLHPAYCAIDMRYHDFEHTLQATVCLLDLIRGRQLSGEPPQFQRRDAELAVLAALLHDAGYLKEKSDQTGTGAKYTLVHVQRSCDFAAGYLPELGLDDDEIADVCAAIRCTGPRNRISAQAFRRPEARIIACLLVTADYLGQMSAPDYPDELGILYQEFSEAFDHAGVPDTDRPYRSEADLRRGTPGFWEKVVRPMLDTEAGAVHRYLATTGHPNPYLQAVETNIAEIRRRLQTERVNA